MSKLIAITVFEGVEPLDIFGPIQVFTTADRLLNTDTDGYEIAIVGARQGTVNCAGGSAVVIDHPWDSLSKPIDTLVVTGGISLRTETPTAITDDDLIDWLAGTAEHLPRVVSVCTGAHLLAAAGILTGRRATTHWTTAPQLAAEYPEITVDPEGIFVRDGSIWTSAGGTAAIDLCLALVADDYGSELARRVARALVMSIRRSEIQSQRSKYLEPSKSTDARIQDLQEWIRGNPSANLSVHALATRVGLSPRHFTRVFRENSGISPAQYVENVRVDVAAQLLLHTATGLRSVARSAGFGSIETLHRVFKRHFGLAPAAYREGFAPTERATPRSGERSIRPTLISQ